MWKLSIWVKLAPDNGESSAESCVFACRALPLRTVGPCGETKSSFTWNDQVRSPWKFWSPEDEVDDFLRYAIGILAVVIAIAALLNPIPHDKRKETRDHEEV